MKLDRLIKYARSNERLRLYFRVRCCKEDDVCVILMLAGQAESWLASLLEPSVHYDFPSQCGSDGGGAFVRKITITVYYDPIRTHRNRDHLLPKHDLA